MTATDVAAWVESNLTIAGSGVDIKLEPWQRAALDRIHRSDAADWTQRAQARGRTLAAARAAAVAAVLGNDVVIACATAEHAQRLATMTRVEVERLGRALELNVRPLSDRIPR